MNPAKGHEKKYLYVFGPFRLDPSERVFAHHDTRIPLAPKAFDTLLLLVQHHGHLLSKEELITTLWPGSFVEENNLTQQISQLRRALGEGGEGSRYIETVPKLGYRFAAEVREIDEEDVELALSRLTRTRVVVREVEEEEEFEADSGPVEVRDIQRVQQTQPKRIPKAWLAGATVVLATTAVMGWYLLRVKTTERNPATELVRMTFDSGLTIDPALSADGRLIAYASDRGGKGNQEIWVQPVGGGEAVRLTDDSVDHSTPAFSPDGRTIAFRSEREGGGVYAISVGGGEARLVAPSGRRPKFSPDGQWIAYWTGTETEDNTGAFMVPGAGGIHIALASGGEAREIHPEFAAAGYPIWAPDSQHILFLGNRDPNVYNETTTDWWVTSIDGGEVVATGAGALFKRLGFPSASQVPEAWTSDGTAILMSATLADTREIWRVPISTKDWRVSASPQQMTFGTDSDMQPSMAGNELVFTSVSEKLDVWSLPVDVDRVERRGDVGRLTNDAFAHTYPAISPDGTNLAFSLQRAGDRDIWIKNLLGGKESEVSIPPGPSFNPNFSPDGKTLIYRTTENRTSVAYAVSLIAGGTQQICADCSDYGWSSDQQKLVLIGTAPARVSILDLGTKQRTPLLDDPMYLLWNARFSPDDRWVSFNATSQGRSRIFVVPVQDGHLISTQEWIAIADSGWDDKPRWSPDGKLLYFVSERDGFRCIWAQRLDEQKHPIGAAIPVFHVHDSSRSLSHIGPGDLSLSVAHDKIVFNMSERTGNLWMLTVNGDR